MRICVAQTRPVTGDIQANIGQHKRLIDTAVRHQGDLLIFPELSLTGYEPTLAQGLAVYLDDGRLHIFQELADTHQIAIGVGAPILQEAGICIGMLLFQPHQPRQLYAKKYLHPDEEPYFVSGHSTVGLFGDKNNVALAICYELSVPEHAANAYHNGAMIYVASVAKYARGVAAASQRLAEIAREYHMTVFMSNSVGTADGQPCAGGSAIWNNFGVLVGQLDDSSQGILIFDTNTQEFTTAPEWLAQSAGQLSSFYERKG